MIFPENLPKNLPDVVWAGGQAPNLVGDYNAPPSAKPGSRKITKKSFPRKMQDFPGFFRAFPGFHKVGPPPEIFRKIFNFPEVR
jgi:hypothetical protein